MINRTIVRTRVVQTLFAYYQDGDKIPATARKELLKEFTDLYDLYHLLLWFAVELTDYAQGRIEDNITKARFTHTIYEVNRRFVENKFAEQVFNNQTLRNYLEQHKLNWESGHTAIEVVYKELINSSFYKEYMSADKVSYEDDKRIWRKIYSTIMNDNEAVISALEEMEIKLDAANWTISLPVILSFVVKTIKRSRQNEKQELLPMFGTEEEKQFGFDLLSKTIENRPNLEELVSSHLKNWDSERIAYMDRIILYTALAELLYFPNISFKVTFDEYIEIAREFSGEKSPLFVNGILNEIMQTLKRENKLIKVVDTYKI